MRIFFALAVASILLAQSQAPAPAPAPSKPTQNDQGNNIAQQDVASNNQGQGNSISAAIDKLTSEIASWKKKADNSQQKNNASDDRWIIWSTIATAISTFFIAVLGYRQWRAMEGQRTAMNQQAEYMRDGLVLTKQAADAATSSAETAWQSLKIAECADVVFFEVYSSDRIRITPGSRLNFSVKNFGRTRAEVAEIEVAWNIAANSDLAHPELAVDKVGPIEIASGDDKTLQSHQCSEWIPGTLFAAIDEGKVGLTYSATISFKDIFGASYIRKYYGCFVPNEGFKQSAVPL